MGIDFEKIKRLQEEKEKFLKENPELQAIQDELDIAMNKAGDPRNRAAIACSFLVNKWNEIIGANEKLQEAVKGEPEKPKLRRVDDEKIQ